MASADVSTTEGSATEAPAAADTPAEEVEAEPPLPSWGTFDYGAGFREVLILKAIEEYLAYHHLSEPLAAFRQDVEKAGLKHTPSRATLEALRDVEDVLLDFDAGRKEDFMTAWERIMPPEFHAGRQGRSLELRLQAHFATSRARAALENGTELEAEELRQDLESFRVFLGQHGLPSAAQPATLSRGARTRATKLNRNSTDCGRASPTTIAADSGDSYDTHVAAQLRPVELRRELTFLPLFRGSGQ